jgi:hypothetical protein
MDKYNIRFSKENGNKLFEVNVVAPTEKEAFLIAVKMAEENNIDIPDEVWTRTRKCRKYAIR